MARTKQTTRQACTPKPLSPLPPGTSPIIRTGPAAVVYHIPTSPNPQSPFPSCNPLKTTILLPPGSSWTSGLHFHTQHTEYLRLLRGCITVQLGSSSYTLSASAGGTVSPHGELRTPGLILTIPKHARHNWGRANSSGIHKVYMCGPGTRTFPKDWTEEVVVEEWTDPSDLQKPLFFWNLNGVVTPSVSIENDALLRKIIERPLQWLGWWVPFQLFVIFWDLDNWPIFVDLKGLWTHGLGERVGRKVEHGVEWAISFVVLFSASLLGKLVGVRAVEEGRTPKDLWDAWRKERLNGRKHD